MGQRRHVAPRRYVASSREQIGTEPGELPLVDLAAGACWKGRREEDSSRDLEGSQPLPSECDDRVFARLCRGCRNDGRDDFFAKRRMRNTKHADARHRRVVGENTLDLERTDLFATAVDHVFNSTRQGQVAVVVEPAQIACPEPAVDEGLCVSVGIVEIPVEYARATGHDLALLTVPDHPPALVDDPHLVEHWHADGPTLAHARG